MNTLYVSQNEKQIQKSLSTSTKSHLKKCFTYALSKNKNDALGLRRNLTAIPNHVFEDHQMCDITWCRFLQNPDIYIPRKCLLSMFTMHKNFQHLKSLSLMKITISWYLPKIPRMNYTRSHRVNLIE